MSYFIKIAKYLGLIIGLCVTGFLVWAIWFAVNFHGNNYKNAESYILGPSNKAHVMSSQKIIDTLYEFQIIHPEYQLITADESMLSITRQTAFLSQPLDIACYVHGVCFFLSERKYIEKVRNRLSTLMYKKLAIPAYIEEHSDKVIVKMALQMNRRSWIRKLWDKSSNFEFDST